MGVSMSFTKKFLFLCFILSLNNLIVGVTNADVLSETVSADIHEPENTYDSNPPTLINLFAKTVIEGGNCVTDDYDGCSFNDVLSDVNWSDDFEPEVKVHITGDGYPDDGLLSNAKIRQRGSLSRSAEQKSFRIKLDKNIPLWRGERRLQLIKSPFDFSRIRNKLSYDLFADIPHIPSMRSQFVNLTLEDQGTTENLGLFTQVEYFGKEYLERRGWDKDSRIYKVERFYFEYNRSAFALNVAGEPLNEDAFERLIEIKRGDSHEELVEMIKGVNNFDLDFQTEIFDRYFNQSNYLAWFAVNMLTNNDDTNWHNYYLYNPIDTENFYFVPWDYDFAWGGRLERNPEVPRPRWSYSPAYYWNNNFHRRFLRTPGNLALIKEAVEEVRQKYLTIEKIAAKRDAYYNVVFPLISSSPDWDFIDLDGTDPEKVAAYNQVFDSISTNVEENYTRFAAQINDPMPFFMGDVVTDESNNISFKWGESKSISNQTISYELEVATDIFFTPTSIIENIPDIFESEYKLHWTHPKGTYFYRVVARNSANPSTNWQIGYDSLITSNSIRAYGVKEFHVSKAGEMNLPESDELEPNPVTGGGSLSWLVLVSSMLLFRKRLKVCLQ